MTDDQHGEGTPRSGGRWDPLPQGDYDDGATAFVKLPEGGIDALLAAADSPLAAPGHGYVPPQITATPGTTAGTDPAATGNWAVPADGAQWPDPNAVPQDTGNDRFTYNPAATQQWNFGETAPQESGPAPGHDVTGQWSIPVAGGDLPDESGEFTTSSLVQQWGGTPPATLPGGAPAPWATEGAGQPWGQPQTEEPTAPGDEPGHEYDHDHAAESPADADHTAGHAAGHTVGHTYEQPPAHPGARPDERMPEHLGSAAHAPVRQDPAAHEPESASAHTAERPARPHDGRHATDPYAQAPAESAVAASQPALGPDEAIGAAEDAQGAVEAPEGPVEPLAEPLAESPVDAVAGPLAANAPDAPDTSTAPDTDAEATDDAADETPPPSGEEHPLAAYVLRVNGVERPVSDAWIGESLLYVLRERLGLAGAKDGCSQGECGACNVQVDGRLVASCLVPAVTAAGSEVRTVEGLAVDGQPSDVQRALARCGAVQCGFCVPGMAMTVHDLLEGNPAPSELETRQALCGNLCRCSGYRGVVDAVKEVVAEREAHSEGDGSEQDGDEARIPHQAGPGAGGVNPSAFESPGFPATPGPHDQAYGQDGGQA
ncbi:MULTISPECIES: 2Fe-2S iron-sulfur cluster-binding protein [unclassified Streptomyces]|uniref:2Fe-2S iron-sulfur cluster-binding protein n=1 Tax=unclassified Streptomyces TaxID=2593676 RepID=UPI0022502D9A|nr:MULTISPECIES: 2Fe-2S iron-sulfur cluster-binding protein [unclassified Streptomyces]MCX5048522.1 2Fe-2S iron-sulfur cluster-binding protein [Streptomyces sp. NBC_00474]